MIAPHGLTGEPDDLTSAYHIAASYLPKKIRLVVFERADIEALASSADLVSTLKQKLLDLLAAMKL